MGASAHFMGAAAHLRGARLAQSSPLLTGWTGRDPLLIQQVQLTVEMFHQLQQRIAMPDLLLSERDAEPPHARTLRLS